MKYLRFLIRLPFLIVTIPIVVIAFVISFIYCLVEWAFTGSPTYADKQELDEVYLKYWRIE